MVSVRQGVLFAGTFPKVVVLGMCFRKEMEIWELLLVTICCISVLLKYICTPALYLSLVCLLQEI